MWHTIIRRAGVGVAIFVLAIGCQGRPSEKPPIHLERNMYDQNKFKPYATNPLFDDDAAMRTPPAGTVARGSMILDSAYMTGFLSDSTPVAKIPVPITMPLLQRGQERFNIYCSPCHGRVGNGKGIVVTRGYVPPPTYHSDLLRDVPDGHIFDVISHGIRNMPSYQHQIPVDDRWAIVAYVRALQRSENASIEDIPVEKRSQVK